MHTEPAPNQQVAPSQFIEIAALAIATILLVIFWPREMRRGPMQLPEGMTPAPLSNRLAAGLIDILPGVLVIMLIYGLDPNRFAQQWPGGGGEVAALEQFAPGFLIIALFVLHTWTSELTTQTTMGKRIFGLKVVKIDGSKPSMGALTARNLLRVLDLIVPVLLLLPLLWPRRQRLGDLVAQTTVVHMAKPSDDADDDNESPKEHSDDA